MDVHGGSSHIYEKNWLWTIPPWSSWTPGLWQVQICRASQQTAGPQDHQSKPKQRKSPNRLQCEAAGPVRQHIPWGFGKLWGLTHPFLGQDLFTFLEYHLSKHVSIRHVIYTWIHEITVNNTYDLYTQLPLLSHKRLPSERTFPDDRKGHSA